MMAALLREIRLGALCVLLCSLLLGLCLLGSSPSAPPSSDGKGTLAAPKEKSAMRVAAAQPKNRTIDFKLKPAEVLAQVDQALGELEKIVHKTGELGCDALALP